jgi:hypothetical protein
MTASFYAGFSRLGLRRQCFLIAGKNIGKTRSEILTEDRKKEGIKFFSVFILLPLDFAHLHEDFQKALL